MNKQFFGVIILVIVLLGGLFVATKKDNPTGTSGGGSVQATKHIIEAPNSKVTLTEYGDFQCPACKSYFPLVAQIKSEYKDKINFQFSHFPLVQIHPNAFLGSRAAEAAGKQGKFFEMHDLLYENQDTWSTSSSPNNSFEAYATQLQLNVDQFKTDMQSAAIADAINADVKAGQAVGVNSTPTFVINGKKVEKNPQSIDEFKKLIDDALAANPQ